MFRRAITFVLIFIVLNHDFAAARSIDFPLVSPFQNVKQLHPDRSDPSEDLEWLDSESDTNKAVIAEKEKRLIFQLDCYGFPSATISLFLGVTMPVVAQYLSTIKGKACPSGVRPTSSG